MHTSKKEERRRRNPRTPHPIETNKQTINITVIKNTCTYIPETEAKERGI